MARLPKFTVRELITSSGCRESVVRGVLDRHRAWIKSETLSIGRPGAPTKAFWLKAEARKALIAELSDLFEQVTGPTQGARAHGDEDHEVWPNELLAAEYLIGEWTNTNEKARAALVKNIEGNLKVLRTRLARRSRFGVPPSDIESRLVRVQKRLSALQESSHASSHSATLDQSADDGIPSPEGVSPQMVRPPEPPSLMPVQGPELKEPAQQKMPVLIGQLAESSFVDAVVETVLLVMQGPQLDEYFDVQVMGFDQAIQRSNVDKNRVVLLTIDSKREDQDFAMNALHRIDEALRCTAFPAGRVVVIESGENTALAARAAAIHGAYVGNVWSGGVNATALSNLVNALRHVVGQQQQSHHLLEGFPQSYR